jgi:glycosyltransferase 2 family protein
MGDAFWRSRRDGRNRKAVPLTRRAKSAGLLILKVVVSAIVIGLLVRNINTSGLSDRFAQQSPSWLISAGLFTLLQIFLVGLRWGEVLRGLGAAVSIRALLAVTYIGSFFGSLLLGNAGGDIARAALAPASARGRAVVIHSVLFDRVITFFGLVIVVLPSLILNLGPFARSIPLLTAVAAAMLPVAGMMAVEWLAKAVRGRQFPLSVRLQEIGLGWHRLCRSSAIGFAVLLSALGQVAISATAYCLARAQGLDVSFMEMLVLMPPVTLLASLPISAGGWGVREAAMIAILAPAGITSTAALLISVELGALAALVSLPGGGIWLARHVMRPAVLPAASAMPDTLRMSR